MSLGELMIIGLITGIVVISALSALMWVVQVIMGYH